MRAIFIRHGQSTGNAGMPCHDLATIELTEKGWNQARRVATDWTETPSLIVTSPFLRTQQTSAPTIEHFPDVPVEVWPIEEFTYLQPSRWNGTLAADRAPHLVRYWGEADPAYCDGEGAESFGALLRRAEATLGRLAALPSPGPVYVFSHGQFIQAVRAVVTESELDDRARCFASGAQANLLRSEIPSWSASYIPTESGIDSPSGASSHVSLLMCERVRYQACSHADTFRWRHANHIYNQPEGGRG